MKGKLLTGRQGIYSGHYSLPYWMEEGWGGGPFDKNLKEGMKMKIFFLSLNSLDYGNLNYREIF